MALRIHDPGHVALRRGIRAAIAVPVATALSIWLLPHSPAGLMAVFGALGLVATSDFGGTTKRRLTSLLGAGVVGAIVIIIGAVASVTVVTAVAVTFVMGSIIAFAAVLHGSIASGAPAITVMYVAATTVGVPIDQAWKMLVGWGIALAVSIPVVVFVLPRRDIAPVREACMEAIRCLADQLDARRAGHDVDVTKLEAANDELQRSYLGNPFRASGINRRDRELLLLVGQVQALLAGVTRGRGYDAPMSDEAITRELVAASAQALHELADALADPRAPAPTGLPVAQLWQEQWGEAIEVLGRDHAAREAIESVGRLFSDRAMAVSAVRLVIIGRRVLDLPAEDYPTGPELHSIPQPPTPDAPKELFAQATLRSPWGRLAIRTGLALALAVLVVSISGLAHGFWVVLGVTAILRFDGLTTVKMAFFAVLGTFVGAGIGFLILYVDFSHYGALWITLILITFLAVYAQAAIGFVVGQAAFSIFVIVGLTITSWPPNLTTATDRLQDVAVGAVISVIIAVLLWPRGVLHGMTMNVAAAIRASNALLRQSLDAMLQGASHVDPRVLDETTGAIIRSQEVVDLSLSSSSGNAAPFAYDWQMLIDELRTPIVAGHLLADWSRDRAPIDKVAPALGPPLIQEMEAATRCWQRLADQIAGAEPTAPPETPDTLGQLATAAGELDLDDLDVADRTVAAVWTHGWLHMSLRAAQISVVPSLQRQR